MYPLTSKIKAHFRGLLPKENRGKKEERTKSFMEGLSTNLENYTEGTYIYNGTNWVLKN